MEFNKYRFADDFSSKNDIGQSMFAGSGITVESFHLKKDTTVMNTYEEENLVNGNHTVVYIVMEGKLEVRIGNERTVVEAGDSLEFLFDRNYSCWAMEDTNMFCVHNCVEPDIDNTPLSLVEAVSKVELSDAYLKGHNYRVGKYSTLLMQAICPERSTARFHMAAAYHDVGKVGVPSEILNKNGKLTDEEFAEIKKHPAVSGEMLELYVGKENAQYARWHHEKLDGSGYPDGISGDQIPLESRIMAVVDIFDALTTDRCYRSGYSFRKALEIMEGEVNAGKLDASVFNSLKHMIDLGIIAEGVDNMYKDANSLVHYDGFTIADIRNALSNSVTGMWKLELREGEPTLFYGDEIMNDLIGVPDMISPEERYNVFISRIHPEDMPLFMSYADNLLREQSEIIYRYNHPDYGTIYVRCGGKRDETIEDCVCIRGFHQNITATVRVEQEKRRLVTESAELYQKMSSKLMENMTSSAMYIDLQDRSYRWLFCNDERMEGIEHYGDLGRRYSSFMPEKYAKQFLKNAAMDHLIEVFQTKDEYSFSVYIYDTKGELRRTTMWYSAVDEAHRYILAVSRDTTEDYQKEQELAKALVDADQANKAKSIFLNNMSHDIRAPMNAIIGFKNLAKKNVDNREKCLDYLSKIETSSEHLLSLINDVLDMSRIESGKIKIVEAPTTISEIMRDLETIFLTGANEKDIVFDVITENVTHNGVQCDKLRVNQILLNCVSNAIKFTPAGGRVELKVTEQAGKEDNKSTYVFTISDTGVGMSQKFLASIYEPFSREETSSTHQIQGTGLGMSICKNLVDLMKGDIGVESELGKGTKFTIHLPMETLEPSEQTESSKEDNIIISLEGYKILLVEDNELNQEIAVEILSELGATVDCADNGQIAVDRVAASEIGYYDFVLMDIQMPVLDGYGATRAIRALDRSDAKDLIIIAMTANAFDEDRQKAFEAGMNEHIAKPINVPHMLKTLGKYQN